MFRSRQMLRMPIAFLLTLAIALSLAVTVSATPPGTHENLALRWNPDVLTLTAPADGSAEPEGTVCVELLDADTGEILENWDDYGVSRLSVKVSGSHDCTASVVQDRVTFTFGARDAAGELHLSDDLSITALDSSGQALDNVAGYGCSINVYWYNVDLMSGYLTLSNCDGMGGFKYLPVPEDGAVSLADQGTDVTGTQVFLDAVDATAWPAQPNHRIACAAVRPFLGWSAEPGGKVVYQPDGVYKGDGGEVLYAVHGDSALVGGDLPLPTELPVREGFLFNGFYGPDGTKLILEKGTPVRDWAVYSARWEKGTTLAITRQPEAEIMVPAGTDVPLSLEAAGEGLTYQWYYREEDTHRLWGPFVPKDGTSAGYTFSHPEKNPVSPEEPEQTWYAWCLVTDRLGNQVVSEKARIIFYYPQGTTEFSPAAWSVQDVEGYELPIAGSITMTVMDDNAMTLLPYTVSGFKIHCTNCDTQADLSMEQAEKYLSCSWDKGTITVTVAPGLPAGTYTWVVMPQSSAEGAEVFPQEFTVNCEIITPDKGMVYYNVNCSDAIYDPPAPTAVTDPLTEWSSQRPTAYCTLDANGGGLYSVKTPDKADPACQAPVQWTFAGWNTKPDGSGTAYAPGGAYKGPGGEILYAQWSGPTAYRFEEFPAGSGGNMWVSRAGYAFQGWFSEKTGGTRLTEKTVAPADSVWYAHWKLTDPSVLTPAVDKPVMSDGHVTVQVTCNVEGAWVWCAVYGQDGRMLGVQQQPAEVGENVDYTFSFGEDAAAADQARVFLLNADGSPLCESGKT